MPITPSLGHCSNKYKLAREGEKDKEKDEDIEEGKDFIFLWWWWCQVVLKEMSFQLLLEDWQGSSIPDGDGKIIPPARNGERECSGEWFWASLWWYHEVSLTSRSQTSGGEIQLRCASNQMNWKTAQITWQREKLWSTQSVFHKWIYLC